MKFIESSVPEGVRVHVRRFTTDDEYITKCDLIDEDNHILCSGESRCHPNDNPSRQIGRRIAVGRAVKTYFGGERNGDD